MDIKITVKRRRMSVTQGMADVYINDILVMSFGDTIEMIEEGEKYYGELIGNWASKIPDTRFVIGMLYHPYDELYHYSERAKKALGKILEKESTEELSIPTNFECIGKMSIDEMHEFLITLFARHTMHGEILSLPEASGLSYNDMIRKWLESKAKTLLQKGYKELLDNEEAVDLC